MLSLGGYSYFQKSEFIGKAAAFSILALIQSFVFIDLWVSHKSVFLFKRSFFSKAFILAFAIPFLLQFTIMQVGQFARIFHVEPVSIMQFTLFTLCASLIFIGIKLFHHIAKRPEV